MFVLWEVAVLKIARLLVDWFHANARDLPWRADYDPYHVFVSEIMLQQTQRGGREATGGGVGFTTAQVANQGQKHSPGPYGAPPSKREALSFFTEAPGFRLRVTRSDRR